MKRSHSYPHLIALAAIFMLLPSTALFAQSAAPSAESASAAWQRGGPGFGHGGPGAFVDRMAEALELSAGQTAEIEEIIAAHQVKTAGLKTEARLAHEAARTIEESDAFDEAAIRAAATKAADAHIELTVERARLRSEIHAVLTPDQLEKAAEIKAKRQERRHHFRDRPGGRHGEAPRDWRR